MILGQVSPPKETEFALYAPGAGKRATVKVVAVNQTAGPVAAVRLVLRPGSGATVDKDYLAFDEGIPLNESRVGAVIDVENPEELRVETSLDGVTFQANGIELDI